MDTVGGVRKPEPFLRKGVLMAMGAAACVAAACFMVAAVLPAPEGPLFKDPLRSFITGVGVLAIAYPLAAVAGAIRRKSATSPYFEGAFIAGAINLAALACAGAGLACVGFGVYDLILWLARRP
ncbi:MAG TPA: hypothetical protein PKH24_17380 [Sedimentisphaerales bacterium]|jgi:hypothetical protein|nr:hypothetical protein [Sedimentisphaerales bacterium]HNU28926.1 hypothetical protein [Sedimentisphaerales bacterium]